MFKSLLKTLAKIVAGLAGLVLLLTLALNYLWSPNQLKPRLEANFLQQTGRELVIAGDLNVSLFPWLGLETGRLQLKNPQGFQEPWLAEVEHSQIRLKFWPLLKQQLELAGVSVKGFKINLLTNRLGERNWLIRQPVRMKAALPTTRSETVSADVRIAGLDFSQGEIVWRDARQSHWMKFSDIQLNSGPWQAGVSTPITLTLNWLDSRYQKPLPVNLKTEFTVDGAFENYRLTPLALSGRLIGGQPYELRSQIDYQSTAEKLSFRELMLKLGPAQAAGALEIKELASAPTLVGQLNTPTFNLAQTLSALGVELPALAASDSLSRFSGRFEFTADQDSFAMTSMTASVDQSHVTGQFKLENFRQPSLTFSVAIDQLDVARYLPAKTKAQPLKTMALTRPENATFSPAVLDTTQSPPTTRSWLALNGQLNIEKARWNQIKGQGLSIQLEGQDGMVQARHALASFYQGQLNGQAEIDWRQPCLQLRLQETLTDVQLQPLLTDWQGQARVDGRLNATATLTTQGERVEQYLAELAGNIDFNLQDSVIQGVNFQQMIDQAKALLAGQAPPAAAANAQTIFKKITGSGTITQGVLHNSDLLGEAARMQVTGEGQIDLRSQTLNYHLKGQPISLESDAEAIKQAEQIPLFLKIKGPWSKPVVQPDLARMLKNTDNPVLERKKQKILDKLERKLGPGASELLQRLF